MLFLIAMSFYDAPHSWSTGYVAGNGAADYVMAEHSAANMKAEPAATASKE